MMRYAVKFDKRPQDKSCLMTSAGVQEQARALSQQVKDDIRWQTNRINRFTHRQRKTINDFEKDTADGFLAMFQVLSFL